MAIHCGDRADFGRKSSEKVMIVTEEEDGASRSESVTVDAIELWDDHTWTEVSIDVPRHIAESESQAGFAAWYAKTMAAPPGMAAVVVSNFNPDGEGHRAGCGALTGSAQAKETTR
jgi:hypothetical protein